MILKFRHVMLFCLAISQSAFANGNSDPHRADRMAIAVAGQKVGRCVVTQSASCYASYYTREATILYTGVPTTSGRFNIQTTIAEFFAAGWNSFELTSESLEFLGDDAAVEIGHYTFGYSDSTAGTGKYSIVWKRVGNKWLLHVDNAIDD